MRRALRVCFILSLIAVFPALADVNAFMIPLSSPLYDTMDALYAVAGRAAPSTSRPWSYAEASRIYEQIDPDTLPEGGAALLRAAEDALAENQPRFLTDGGTFGFDLRVSLNPEVYAHTNGEYSIDSDNYNGVYDWRLVYEDRLPFLGLGFDISANSFFYGYVVVDYTRGRFAGHTDYNEGECAGSNKVADSNIFPSRADAYSNNFSLNFAPTSNIEMNVPKRAFLAFGGEAWYLTLGRERMNWGDSHIGNFLIDDGLEYQDAVRFATYTQNNTFRFEMLYSFFDGGIAESGGSGESETAADGTGDEAGAPSGGGHPFKMLMAHRFDIRPADWISITLSENVMYNSGTDGGISPQHLNPFMFFHNLYLRNYFNSFSWAEITVSPRDGVTLYGQAALDQFNLGGLEGNNSDSNAFGFLLGGEYTRAMRRGFLTTSLEGAYTSPLLYRRDKVDFIVWHRSKFTTDTIKGDAVKLYYLGFPYGGDALVVNLDAWYTMPGVFRAGFEWRGMLHGDTDMTTLVEKDTARAPFTGNLLKQMSFSLAGEYSLPFFERYADTTVRSTLTLVFKDEDSGKSCDFQTSLGASIKI